MSADDHSAVPRLPDTPHSLPADAVLTALQASRHGLSRQEAGERRQRHGANTLPREQPPGIWRVFLRQFLSPLIYILLLATIISMLIGEWMDATFISAVLLLNAIIGAAQEFSAQRSAEALQQLITTSIRVIRDGDAFEINTEELVPGDIVLLESGNKVPADLRLIDGQGLDIDESLLTGESHAVIKQPDRVLDSNCLLGDRVNMAFAGTYINRGRGTGVVTATGLATELGKLALSIMTRERIQPPLMQRMERFVMRIGLAVAGAALLMAVISLLQGMPLAEIFFLAVALTVSAIPEGLPVAITVALTIGLQRMAKNNVIVRRLVAVESLGSCTCIASDKTGTLTMNEMTVRHLALPGGAERDMFYRVSGEGMVPAGEIIRPGIAPVEQESAFLEDMARCAVLCNEGFLGHRDGSWTGHGDSVDIALLALGHKAGITRPEALTRYPQLKQIPFEAEARFAASLHDTPAGSHAYVKGALERLLPMCSRMRSAHGEEAIDRARLEALMQGLAQTGDRVLALASGPLTLHRDEVFSQEHLHGLTLLGLVGMSDPLRPEALAAVKACRDAGIEVCMVTGDHPETALVIARDLGLATTLNGVVTGNRLQELAGGGPQALDTLVAEHRVFARIEPQQKLQIVEALIRGGHFVAVTGDGANDAPALRAAHVGVAMGRKGTDVARESADIIITDDNFASLVSGIEQGRITYRNIRKVIFLLISTGAAEVILFLLALLGGLPVPLFAAQLLWLNLVTNGIQDVALAFDPAEGDEMGHPPRPPREPIFNRIMIERVLLSAITIGCLAFALFSWLIAQGYSVDAARNSTLLLMVLFENVHVFNSRSERYSAFGQNPLRNPLLLFGTLTAQLIHIGAMYTPGLSTVLGIAPISLTHWFTLLLLALTLLAVMELHKLLRRRLMRR